MSFFRFPVIGKFSEFALRLRISRVSQPQKILQIAGRIWRFLQNLRQSANSQSTFNSTQKKKKSFIGKFSEIALRLRISRVSQPQKNPLNSYGESGGRILAKAAKFCKFSVNILFYQKKTKACSEIILPFTASVLFELTFWFREKVLLFSF